MLQLIKLTFKNFEHHCYVAFVTMSSSCHKSNAAKVANTANAGNAADTTKEDIYIYVFLTLFVIDI